MSERVVLTFPHALGIPGGGPVHCHRLALELAQAGAEVTLVPVESATMSMAPRPRPTSEQRSVGFVRSLAEAKITVRPVAQSPLAWWLDGLGVRRELIALDRERPLDAVLGWWGELAFALPYLTRRGVFTAILAAAPYALWWQRRRGRPRWLHRSADEWLVARSIRRVDRVFANSRHAASQVVSLLGAESRKVEVVPPPLDARFAAIERQPSDRIEHLLYFGRLRFEKGVFDLIEALGQLRGERWQLRIAGSGDLEGARRALETARIAERAEILGPVGREALEALLAWADLVVLPSYAESFGLAVAEAQLAGLPVIAYDIDAIREIHRDGETGWMVPVGRTDRLAEAIREALRDRDEVERRGRRAREVSTAQLLDEPPGRRILERIAAERGDNG